MSLVRSSNTQDFKYDTVVLDLNGTLANYGKINPSTVKLLKKLATLVPCYLLTWDHRGNAHTYEEYGLNIHRVSQWYEKWIFVNEMMQRGSVVTIGNARIDKKMFEESDLALGIIWPEWFHMGAIKHVDVMFTNINHALHFLLDEVVFGATMKE